MKVLIAYDGSECAASALLDLTRAGLPREVAVTILSVDEVWLPLPLGLTNAAAATATAATIEFTMERANRMRA